MGGAFLCIWLMRDEISKKLNHNFDIILLAGCFANDILYNIIGSRG
jgi:hypothetical protein